MQISLTKNYQFSAAHRLNSDYLNDQANFEIYDKCNNLNGHGHDYSVWVTVAGQPDSESGMIIPASHLDDIVNQTLEKLDYKHLDKEVDYFKEEISTAENIIQFIWRDMERRFKTVKLIHLKLWETNNNYFELGREL
jgi:6-pyruvoyltetrahydropterin/6-carboxytetrahydropterin synthase